MGWPGRFQTGFGTGAQMSYAKIKVTVAASFRRRVVWSPSFHGSSILRREIAASILTRLQSIRQSVVFLLDLYGKSH